MTLVIISLVQRDLGDLAGTRGARAGAPDYEPVYGADNPEVARTPYRHRRRQRVLGDLEAARERVERALASRRQLTAPTPRRDHHTCQPVRPVRHLLGVGQIERSQAALMVGRPGVDLVVNEGLQLLLSVAPPAMSREISVGRRSTRISSNGDIFAGCHRLASSPAATAAVSPSATYARPNSGSHRLAAGGVRRHCACKR